MRTINSIEKPVLSDSALSQFNYMFWRRLLDLEEGSKGTVVFAQQAKIKRLRGLMRNFILNRAYSFFRIVELPPNGEDIENAEVSLEIKNFEFFVQGMQPKRHVLVISNTWDSFTAFEETVDKNLIKMKL